mgnify:CR=1 FL=1
MSSGAMKLTLAAAAATAETAALAYSSSSAFGVRRGGSDANKRQHFNVPPEILNGDCEYKDEVILAVRLALEGENIEYGMRNHLVK